MLVSRHIAIAGLVLILRVFSLKWSWAFAQNAEDLPFSFPDLTPEQKAQFSQWLKDQTGVDVKDLPIPDMHTGTSGNNAENLPIPSREEMDQMADKFHHHTQQMNREQADAVDEATKQNEADYAYAKATALEQYQNCLRNHGDDCQSEYQYDLRVAKEIYESQKKTIRAALEQNQELKTVQDEQYDAYRNWQQGGDELSRRQSEQGSHIDHNQTGQGSHFEPTSHSGSTSVEHGRGVDNGINSGAQGSHFGGQGSHF